uniref:Tumor necrosis factor receptor superfamily, member 1a n=1 Tax=Myripristis murdjan TaxID=586833 RepID=A0A667X0J7_9TELE
MEGVGLWNKKPHGGSVCTLLILLLFPTLGLTKPQPLEEECPVGDFRSDDGICCNKCAQGFRYVADCQAEGQRTSCKPCEEGETFMDQMNYTPNCKICKRCKSRYEVMVSPCSKERNTVCRCKTGFYKEVIGPGTDQCIKCHSCGLREIQTYCMHLCKGMCTLIHTVAHCANPPFICVTQQASLLSLLPAAVSELIYTVLDLVPVPQVKQLVRSLGVTDTEIERAEADHRACKEAHYQMLRMWAERGSQSRGGSSGVMLHRPLLHALSQSVSA